MAPQTALQIGFCSVNLSSNTLQLFQLILTNIFASAKARSLVSPFLIVNVVTFDFQLISRCF